MTKINSAAEIKARCEALSKPENNSSCAFCEQSAAGFIDFSPKADGTRGIAFFDEKLAVKTAGELCEVNYDDIVRTQLIASYEDAFADELVILTKGSEIRICDYSVDKRELKKLIDFICFGENAEENIEEKPEENIEENIEEKPEENIEENIEEKPGEIPEQTAEEDVSREVSEELEKIEGMSRTEKIEYLGAMMSEFSDQAQEDAPEQHTELAQDAAKGQLSQLNLTKEPAWGDIYIKASRALRELCEAGKLSMARIEAELRERLLESAAAFVRISADESRVPKVLMPRITELKNAAENLDDYFKYGEDIAVRAMFFMLYQMLSYADRIVENPEAKERLNDFFRRFGAAGITLSMLDMRV